MSDGIERGEAWEAFLADVHDECERVCSSDEFWPFEIHAYPADRRTVASPLMQLNVCWADRPHGDWVGITDDALHSSEYRDSAYPRAHAATPDLLVLRIRYLLESLGAVHSNEVVAHVSQFGFWPPSRIAAAATGLTVTPETTDLDVLRFLESALQAWDFALGVPTWRYGRAIQIDIQASLGATNAASFDNQVSILVEGTRSQLHVYVVLDQGDVSRLILDHGVAPYSVHLDWSDKAWHDASTQRWTVPLFSMELAGSIMAPDLFRQLETAISRLARQLDQDMT